VELYDEAINYDAAIPYDGSVTPPSTGGGGGKLPRIRLEPAEVQAEDDEIWLLI
jgi:hypothetical protein